MNEHQISREAVARTRDLSTNQMSGAPVPDSIPLASGRREVVMMHASEADYLEWVVAESRLLEKQNALLRGLLLKASHELRKSNPACAEMLTSITPARAQPPLPTT